MYDKATCDLYANECFALHLLQHELLRGRSFFCHCQALRMDRHACYDLVLAFPCKHTTLSSAQRTILTVLEDILHVWNCRAHDMET